MGIPWECQRKCAERGNGNWNCVIVEMGMAAFFISANNSHGFVNKIFMAALWNRAGPMYFHPVVSSSSFFMAALWFPSIFLLYSFSFFLA